MIYILEDSAGDDTLSIKGELHKYLIKVRRHKLGDSLCFRSKEDIKILHTYILTEVTPKKLSADLQTSEILEVKAKKELHIGWCKIDFKSIEKMLPSLSEIGVSKITFIDCERSQRNIKIDYKRLDRILEASMQQCGSTHKIVLEESKNLDIFVKANPNAKVFDFTKKTLDDVSDISCVIIGCEGGFSKLEKELLNSLEVFRLDTPMVLRSESAVMVVASKVLV